MCGAIKRAIAEYFGNAGVHQSHSLGIHRQAAKDAQLVVDDLEGDQDLQDCVLSVHHATVHTLNAGTLKIIENHLDRAYCTIPVAPQFPIQLLPQFPQVPPLAPPP